MPRGTALEKALPRRWDEMARQHGAGKRVWIRERGKEERLLAHSFAESHPAALQMTSTSPFPTLC